MIKPTDKLTCRLSREVNGKLLEIDLRIDLGLMLATDFPADCLYAEIATASTLLDDKEKEQSQEQPE